MHCYCLLSGGLTSRRPSMDELLRLRRRTPHCGASARATACRESDTTPPSCRPWQWTAYVDAWQRSMSMLPMLAELHAVRWEPLGTPRALFDKLWARHSSTNAILPSWYWFEPPEFRKCATISSCTGLHADLGGCRPSVCAQTCAESAIHVGLAFAPERKQLKCFAGVLVAPLCS